MSVEITPLISIADDADAKRVDLLVTAWLLNRPANTVRSYTRTVRHFLAHAQKPPEMITADDIGAWAATMTHIASSSQGQRLAAVKSFLKYAHQSGAIGSDPGGLVRLPQKRETLAARILSEDEVRRLIGGEREPRNHALLTLLYMAGLRVSEAVNLRWSDAIPRGEGVTLTIYGKGGKTRYVPLPAAAWRTVAEQRDETADGPVFGAMSAQGAWRIVKIAAKRAGLSARVSPHWLRHAHATHAIERGAPLHLIQQTLGHSSVAVTSKYLHARPQDSSARYLDL